MEFINNQVYPGYKTLGDALTLDFVPFGKAKVRHDYVEHWIFWVGMSPRNISNLFVFQHS